jgi:flagellar biosynthesis/type III secretory pathway M-ring protein FliF/YscJ
MSGLIVAIVVIAILAIVLFAVVMPRARAKARERELVRRRDEVAGAHRAEHERGLADDELDAERERLGVSDRDPEGRSERFDREPTRDPDRDVAPEERR